MGGLSFEQRRQESRQVRRKMKEDRSFLAHQEDIAPTFHRSVESNWDIVQETWHMWANHMSISKVCEFFQTGDSCSEGSIDWPYQSADDSFCKPDVEISDQLVNLNIFRIVVWERVMAIEKQQPLKLFSSFMS